MPVQLPVIHLKVVPDPPFAVRVLPAPPQIGVVEDADVGATGSGFTVTVGWTVMVTTEHGERVPSTLNCVVVVRLPVDRLIVEPVPPTALPTAAPASVFNWYETPLSELATWMFVLLPEHTELAAALTVLSAGT